jgi:hypothetical protein
MHLVLLLIGLLVTLAGLATIGFGIPINEFSLGNTLIIAGTMALSAGLILIGLAAALRQLRRIEDALATRPIPRVARLPEPDALAGTPRPGAGRTPFPSKPSREDAARDVRPEPRFVAAGNQAEVEEADAPLSPQVSRGPGASREARLEAPWRPVTPTDMSTEWPGKNEMFDSLWPRGSRSNTGSTGSAKAEATPPSPATQREVADEQRAAGEERRGVSILKSGVVDGMAYTLYADGSIEAELPEGMVRFASIDELRAHLEKHS